MSRWISLWYVSCVCLSLKRKKSSLDWTNMSKAFLKFQVDGRSTEGKYNDVTAKYHDPCCLMFRQSAGIFRLSRSVQKSHSFLYYCKLSLIPTSELSKFVQTYGLTPWNFWLLIAPLADMDILSWHGYFWAINRHHRLTLRRIKQETVKLEAPNIDKQSGVSRIFQPRSETYQ